MQSHQHHETKVQEICRLAKAGDKAAIREIIESGVCIGLYENSYNAVMLLAKEGHVDAMWFLINAFGASVSDAVRGAAWGGHEALVWRLIEEGAKKEYALEGAGLAGNLTLAKQLISTGEDALHAMTGAAERDNEDWQELVNQLMVYGRYKAQQQIDRSRLVEVVKYVEQLPGLKPQLEEVDEPGLSKWEKLQELVTPDTLSDEVGIQAAIQAAAELGYFELAKELIKHSGYFNSALVGAVQGGHDEFVIDLVREGAYGNYAAIVAARFNNIKLIESLKKLTNKNLVYSTMVGAAQAGDFERVKLVFARDGRKQYAEFAKKENLDYLETCQLFMRILSDNELNFIVKGTARGGKIEFTEQLIAAGAKQDPAYLGAAMGCQTQLVNRLCESGAISEDDKASVAAAARRGDTDSIRRLMQDDVDMCYSVVGAVEGEQIGLINEFLVRGQAEVIIDLLKEGNYLINEAYTLRLLCFINDDQVRYRLAEAFYLISRDDDTSEVKTCAYLLFHKANKLRFLMKQHDFDYNQAQAWLTPQLHIMFLQVFPALKDQLPLEIFLSIASFLTNTADAATSVMTYNNIFTLFKKHKAIVPELLREKATDDAAEARFKKRTSF